MSTPPQGSIPHASADRKVEVRCKLCRRERRHKSNYLGQVMGYVTFDELGRGYWAEALQRSTGPGRRQVNQARPYTLRVTPGSYENSRWRGSLINRPALDVVEQNRPAHRPALDIVDPDRPADVAYVWADAFYKDPDSVVRFTCRVGRHKARTITPEELEERAREALESGYSHLHL